MIRNINTDIDIRNINIDISSRIKKSMIVVKMTHIQNQDLL